MADPGEGLARPVLTTLFFDVFHEPLSWVPPTTPQSLDPALGNNHYLTNFRKVMHDPAAETQGLQYLLYSILQIL